MWNETTAGTTSGATTTKAGISGQLLVCRHISGHSDVDTIIQITNDDDTVLFETKLVTGQNGNGFSIAIPDGIHSGVTGGGLKGKVASSTSDCQVTLSGFSI